MSNATQTPTQTKPTKQAKQPEEKAQAPFAPHDRVRLKWDQKQPTGVIEHEVRPGRYRVRLDKPASIAVVEADLLERVHTPLRERLERVSLAGGQPQEATAHMMAAFRDWLKEEADKALVEGRDYGLAQAIIADLDREFLA